MPQVNSLRQILEIYVARWSQLTAARGGVLDDVSFTLNMRGSITELPSVHVRQTTARVDSTTRPSTTTMSRSIRKNVRSETGACSETGGTAQKLEPTLRNQENGVQKLGWPRSETGVRRSETMGPTLRNSTRCAQKLIAALRNWPPRSETPPCCAQKLDPVLRNFTSPRSETAFAAQKLRIHLSRNPSFPSHLERERYPDCLRIAFAGVAWSSRAWVCGLVGSHSERKLGAIAVAGFVDLLRISNFSPTQPQELATTASYF